MAIWFSKDKKTMVNLDMVSSFNYYNKDDVEKFSDPFGYGSPQEINEVKMHGHFIILKTMGHEIKFRG